jgi:hypothetical protein
MMRHWTVTQENIYKDHMTLVRAFHIDLKNEPKHVVTSRALENNTTLTSFKKTNCSYRKIIFKFLYNIKFIGNGYI